MVAADHGGVGPALSHHAGDLAAAAAEIIGELRRLDVDAREQLERGAQPMPAKAGILRGVPAGGGPRLDDAHDRWSKPCFSSAKMRTQPNTNIASPMP